ncbi:putative ARM-like repeat-containing protein [Golovinomyces cichoracearum]|uniref:Putative ARM-like repeat-containing protein n=1 Tax=Golovinomyces cichoracearum TaxID=62708 RepID=A0A420I6V3_9PEZI|nr:putative ARM-like repeat-containing protein [Golovinomyces cichoracearum]
MTIHTGVKEKTRKRTEFRKIKPLSDPELVKIREEKIFPAIKDLQSPDLAARSSAVGSILKLVTDVKSSKLFLREQIVKILLDQTLKHSDLETKADGWCILKSIAQEEDTDFCVHLSRMGILETIDPTLKLLIETIESHNRADSKPTQAQRDLVWNLTTTIVNLLSLLSGSHDEVVDEISKFPIVLNFLFGLLMTKSTPLQVQLGVQSCLITLTEDNKAIVEQIMESDNWFKTLIVIKDSNQTKAIYACRILHNIFATLQWFDYNTPAKDMSDAMLIPVLTKHLADITNDEINGQIPSSSGNDLQLALETIALVATTLQEAIEHCNHNEKGFVESADGCAAEDTDIEVEKDVIPGENEDERIDADMEMVTGYETDHEDEIKNEGSTLDHLVHNATPEILRIFQTKKNISDSLKGHALAALNNISWVISNIDDSSTYSASLQKFRASLAQEIWDQVIRPSLKSDTDDIELAPLITGLAWAVARSVKGAIKLVPKEEEEIIRLYQVSRDSENNFTIKQTRKEEEDVFQGLGVKCIGILGNLAREPAEINLNRSIGKFLVTIPLMAPEAPLADVVESLNQIFDIYSDDRFSFDDPVFWGEKLYESLEESLPKVKKMANSIDKRKYAELRTRADESIFNLGRFLAYKKKEKKNKKS